jgi:hypothetical protein
MTPVAAQPVQYVSVCVEMSAKVPSPWFRYRRLPWNISHMASMTKPRKRVVTIHGVGSGKPGWCRSQRELEAMPVA